MLGTTSSAFNQTWHALTSKFDMTGEHYVRMACEITKRKYAIQAIPSWGVGLLGVFVPVLREFLETMYQFESDYRFDSTKFEQAFNQQATEYRVGIEATLQ